MTSRKKIKITSKRSKILIKGTDDPNNGTNSPSKGSSGRSGKGDGYPSIFKKYKYHFSALISFLAIALVVAIAMQKNRASVTQNDKNATQSGAGQSESAAIEETDDYSLNSVLARLKQLGGYRQDLAVLESNTRIANLLLESNLPKEVHDELIYQADRKNIDVLQAKKRWYTITSRPEGEELRRLFVYELSPTQYYLINAIPIPYIDHYVKAEEVKIKSVGGQVTESLWDAIQDSKGDYRIVEKMEDALKWVVDFQHVKTNDKFKVIYEEKWVEGKLVDVGNLLAITFYNDSRRYDAFYYKDEHIEGFFNREGQSMKKRFLKSPVKYNRITSPFSPTRMHPVDKVVRPHWGTDYWAKEGDAIFAVADGAVMEATFKQYNGNYIKIKHDEVYQTQYLHIMENGFAKGIEKGAKVKQGQVIGYVGETGLTTGPHVCYRFWKNGTQVDPLEENAFEFIDAPLLDRNKFKLQRDSMLGLLREIPFFEL